MKTLPFKSLQPIVYKSLGMRSAKKLAVLSNPCHDEQGRFCSTGSGGRQVAHQIATSVLASQLNQEWTNTHGQYEGPFWNVEGERNGRYYTNRDESGKLVAGATTIQKGMSTEILSISSHAPRAGVDILSQIKTQNIFLIALASSDASKSWFIRNGFREVNDKPGQYNVKWRRPNEGLSAHALSTPGQKKSILKPGAKPRLVKINGLLAHQTSSRVDPTRTTGLRNRWAAEMGRRFTALRRLIWKTIVDEDCFGLGPAYKLYRPAVHSNPCHDEQGRFCSTGGGSGAGSFSDIKGANISEFDSWPSGDRKNYAREAVLRGGDGFVLRQDGEIKGIVTYDLGFWKPGPGEKTTLYLQVDRLATKEFGYGRKMMQEVCNRAVKEHGEERKEIAKIFPDEAKQSLGVMLVSARDAEGFYRKIGMKNRPDSYMYHFSPKQAKDFSKHGRLTELEAHSDNNEPENGIFTVPNQLAPTVHVKFDFPRLEDKIPAFMAWLQQQQDEGILELVTLPRMGQSLGEPWTNLFVRDSYERGVIRAREQLKSAGYGAPGLGAGDLPLMGLPGMTSGVLANPFHVDRLASVFLRSYDGLKGISSAMSMQISHVLAQGLADGDNPITLAKKMNYVISGTGKDLGITDSLGRFIPAERRAKMLARTEVIRSHHLATVQEYRNWGVVGVNVVAEWVTAGFNVCPICQDLARKGPYTLDQAQNMLPAHVYCRCTTIPRPMGEISVHSNLCHNPAGPGGGQFCPTGGGVGSADGSWKVSNSVEEAKRQFKDKFGDVFKGQGVSGDVAQLNVLGHETARLREFIPDKMWKSGDFKTDYVGVYSKTDWEKAKSFEGMSKGAGGLYKHGDDFGAIIKMSGDIPNKHDKVTLGKHLATEPTLRSVYRHEFGHFVHLRGLSKSQADEWEGIWGSSSVSKSSVSKYAMTNSKEFFAESFAAYTSKGYSSSTKKLPAQVESFFKKVLR